jgi:hypothetical protein
MLKNINPNVKKLAVIVTVHLVIPVAVAVAAAAIEKKMNNA